MDLEKLKKTVDDIRAGKISRSEAVKILKNLPYQDLNFAKIDHHRNIRKGFPEVVYAKGKLASRLIKIIDSLVSENETVLVTKLSPEKFNSIKKDIPTHIYEKEAESLVVGRYPKKNNMPPVPVITAGTSDIKVAKEAVVVLKATGNRVNEIYDVGVSGVHRFLDIVKETEKSRVAIVVAGMDGVLPSLAGGIMSQPVIAVPTSVGYGANFDGIAPLLTMLNSCAPGVLVVNIDNGFGAGFSAAMINSL